MSELFKEFLVAEFPTHSTLFGIDDYDVEDIELGFTEGYKAGMLRAIEVAEGCVNSITMDDLPKAISAIILDNRVGMR